MRTQCLSVFRWMTLVLFAALLAAPAWAGAIRRVKHDAAGTGDGTSWENAFTCLQLALNVAENGDAIWVAAGTYKPPVPEAPADPRSANYTMVEGVAIYGGFVGTETASDERDGGSNVTILSGDIGDAGDVSDNSYTVVRGASNARLDGLTVTGGIADGTGGNVSDPHRSGGGMYNSSVSDLLISNCVFVGNLAATDVGGMGGGMFNWNSNPTITNCTFSANVAGYSGGGMTNLSSSPTITNCLFHLNQAFHGGGMDNVSGSSSTITNCTFSGNTATADGGAMYNGESAPIISNCIFWGNAASGEVSIDGYFSTPVVTYSCIQGWTGGGTGNVTVDPKFINATTGDFHLLADSPCVNAGTNAPFEADGAAEGIDTDLDGNPRIFGEAVDMGAYELQTEPIGGGGGGGKGCAASSGTSPAALALVVLVAVFAVERRRCRYRAT